MNDATTEIPYGTLDLLVLKTLDSMGPLHGFAVARRIEQVAEHLVHLNQGSIYPALMRLKHKGWITTEWGTSENGRRAKFYSLTSAGREQLRTEEKDWRRTALLMQRFLALE